MKILTGVYRPAGGRVLLDGREIHFGSSLEALHAGIGVVHQEHNLVHEFSIAGNIALQHLPHRLGVVHRARMCAEARCFLDLLDLDLDPATRVAELSVAQAQLVEIAKALSVDTRVLLLDEPTASLTGEEADRLYAIVRKLIATGHAVVLVSHKLEEAFTVTVLRDGHSVAEAQPLSGYTRNVSLAVARGEILGLYGLVGAAARSWPGRCSDWTRSPAGRVRVHGVPVRIRDVGEALRRHRIGYVPEDRKGEGLFLEQPITRNVGVTVWRRLSKLGLILDCGERDIVDEYTELLGIRLASRQQLSGQLSGGNQQKVSLAKWLAANCDILIVDEPTVGIDVRTKAAFHELIARLAGQGRACLLISSDLPELVTLSDRIAVMGGGAVRGELVNDHDYDTVSQRVIRHPRRPLSRSDAAARGSARAARKSMTCRCRATGFARDLLRPLNCCPEGTNLVRRFCYATIIRSVAVQVEPTSVRECRAMPDRPARLHLIGGAW